MNGNSIDTDYKIAQLEEGYKQQTLAMACSLISLIDLRDSYTGGHSARVAEYVRGTTLQIGMGEDEAENVVLAASLHDIGKIGVPDHVLLKPGKLTDEEFGWIRKHPEWGWMAIRNVEGFQDAALLLLHHHERLDGRGYPGGLKGSAIPLGARMIAVADSFDALTTNRPYRRGRSVDEALSEIQRCAGPQFDPEIVRAFCASMDRMSFAAIA
jgi:HD-GYP domain-containing protein (c-di-GMP phosphodiesterase class II)